MESTSIEIKLNLHPTVNLIIALQKYNDLLLAELTETVPKSTQMGWKTTRYEEGVKMREEIAELVSKVKVITE